MTAMILRTILRASGIICLQALCIPLCRANGLAVYTTQASFDSAVSSGFMPLSVANFDGMASGTLVPNGTFVGAGVTLSYAPDGGGPFEMDVISGLPTTSLPNYLGSTTTGGPTSEFDAFGNGDQMTMTFANPEQAVGLFIITAGPNFPGDFTLSVSQGTGTISGIVDPSFASLLPDSSVFFLGLVDTTAGDTFTTATLSSLQDANVGPGAFVFNIDDIVSASAASTGTVPEQISTPGLLLIAGTALLTFHKLRRTLD
jgi:hypothetical protein